MIVAMGTPGFHSSDRKSVFWRLLSVPSIYSVFQDCLAVRSARARLMERYGKVKSGDSVLDVGCGPADILQYLPEVSYLGIDRSDRYVPAARRRYHRYGNRVAFEQLDVNALGAERKGQFDLVLALGLLHHLSDEQASTLLQTLSALLRPGGRVLTVDGAFTDHQHWGARLLLRADRGRFVRHVNAYRTLAETVFPRVDVHVHDDLLRLPYTHVIMECHAIPHA